MLTVFSLSRFVLLPPCRSIRCGAVTQVYMIRIPAGLRLFLFIAFALAILVLSVMPSPPEMIQEVLSWDKAQHALAYAVFTLLGGWAMTPVFGASRAWRLAFALAIGYGLVIEVLQGMGGRRSPQLADGAADIIGAAVVYLIWFVVFRLRQKGSCS
jgi:VanZ family protein